MSLKTISVDLKQKRRFDDFQWRTRSKSQNEALKRLLDLADKKVKKGEIA